MENFKDYWKGPFYMDELGIFVHDSNGKKICDFLVNDNLIREAVLDILNEKEKPEENVAITRLREQATLHGCSITGDTIVVGHAPILRVRGWGYLTGKGFAALGLNNEKAIEVQNDVLQKVKSALTD